MNDVLEYIFPVFYRSKAMLCGEQPVPDDDEKDGGGQDEALEQANRDIDSRDVTTSRAFVTT